MKRLVDYYINKALDLGATDAVEIKPKNIVFDSRVFLKCMSCMHYGNKPLCPPLRQALDYKEMIKRYDFGILVFVLTKTTHDSFESDRRSSSKKLLRIVTDLEKFLFNNGFYFATSFSAGSCRFCEKCSGFYCKNPTKSRLPMESIGIDVVKTCAEVNIKVKFPICDMFYRIGLVLY